MEGGNGMKMKTLKTPLVAAFCALALGGCAYHTPADYHAYQAQGEQTVRFGVVETVREVRLQHRETGIGGASGAMLGGIAGSTVGGSSSANAAGMIAGAILGGVIGQQVERSNNERPGVEVTVQLDSGKYVAIVQEADEQFRAGDRVRILSGRGLSRVTH
jgi:outer membrane lipoprotein SlyB